MNLLIGHTGFVGSNLNHKDFDKFVNSKNYKDIKNNNYKKVVCCGFSGTKYMANADPTKDWNNIKNLLDVLETIKCESFVLISTIDVYYQHSYAKHRLKIENILSSKFSNIKIYRLPGVYGKNIKKNAIYDLIHKHNLDQISPQDRYQWYSLDDLNDDINKNKSKFKIIELFPESITIQKINNMFFNYDENLFSKKSPTKNYNHKPYLYDQSNVLKKLKTFLEKIQ
jgi:hypothetical protein